MYIRRNILNLTTIKKNIVILFCSGLMLIGISGCKKTTDPICNEWTFYIPNAFEPNANGLNDTFEPRGTGVNSFAMWIFDNTGKQIFYTTDINAGWNGAVQGSINICPQGYYPYKITATDACGYNHTYTGSVILLK